MIKFDEFYRTIGDLHVGQEAHVYSGDDASPCMIFKKCEELGCTFILVHDIASCELGIVQDTKYMSFSVSLMGFFDDLSNNYDNFRIEVKNRESFVISCVSREDLEEKDFDTSDVDDETMDQLANKLGDDYCEQMFWISLEIIAEEGLDIPRKEGFSDDDDDE